MGNVYYERLSLLREKMQEENIGAYIVPSADEHESEYVPEHFRAREFLTGFTGSAGIAVVTPDDAALWTDGRYFIQAERELEGSGFRLMKMGVEGVPDDEEFIRQSLSRMDGLGIGFFGKTMNTKNAMRYMDLADTLGEEEMKTEHDLVGEIWGKARPKFVFHDAWWLDDIYSGETVESKLARVRDVMEDYGAEYHLIAALEDCNWLLNIRGKDNGECAVANCFVLMNETDINVYMDISTLKDSLYRKLMSVQGLTIYPYDQIYEDISDLNHVGLLYDPQSVNYALSSALDDSVDRIEWVNPTMMMKAVKNEVELENIRKAHEKDGVAMVRFLKWLEEKMSEPFSDTNPAITEVDASDYLDARRAEQEGFVMLSFDTISACNENAAMMHYNAKKGQPKTLDHKGFLLVDSGGHYLQGTTDVTRTICLGEVPDEWKKHYTLTLKGMLNLANAKFLYGCKGVNLDILARGPLWAEGIDYRCGTGHGVGYTLSVHEPPNGFRWRIVPERNDSATLEAGMVTTDEPGVYVEGSHGIRIENELICRKAEVNEYGQFMDFEVITYVPIDLEAIDARYMAPVDIERLNEYHEMVYRKLAPYLSEEECKWLQKKTRKFG